MDADEIGRRGDQRERLLRPAQDEAGAVRGPALTRRLASRYDLNASVVKQTEPVRSTLANGAGDPT